MSKAVGRHLTDWERQANKALVVLCRNATLLVSFAGLAFIDGLPTDDWIAQKLLQRALPEPRLPGGGTPAIVGDRSIRMDVGPVAELLCEVITTDFKRQADHYREQGLQLMVSGYTWKRIKRGELRPRHLQMIMRAVRDSPGDVRLERIRRWYKPAMVATNCIGAILPTSNHFADLSAAVWDTWPDVDATEIALRDTVRAVGSCPTSGTWPGP